MDVRNISDYVERMEIVLRRTIFSGWQPEVLASDAYTIARNDQLYRRYEDARDVIVPWVRGVHDLRDSLVVEVGCGTGCTASAFAEYSKLVIGFDLNTKAVDAFVTRMEILGLTNANAIASHFSEESYLALQVGRPKVILLIAVLEHMKFAERIAILRASWRLLEAGGILVVGDTPNRLSPFDHHSSLLPFFHWLPNDVREMYGRESQKLNFTAGLARSSAQGREARDLFIQRYGLGVSYHDFEIALGKTVHQKVIADANDRIIQQARGWTFEDSLIQMLFDYYRISAHRCFARRSLYLILQKSR